MDPNPIKHIGSLLKAVRERIETELRAAGYEFAERNNPVDDMGEPRWIDYRGADSTLSVRYEPRLALLAAERLDPSGEFQHVDTCLDGVRSSGELTGRIDEFAAQVRSLIAIAPA